MRLIHGSTIHGMQLSNERSSEPTTYYGKTSGVGLVLESMQEKHDELNIGVVGLGCSVLATYGRPTDHMQMIEINPAVIEIANTHFSFLADSKARITTHTGDGRLILERMSDDNSTFLCLMRSVAMRSQHTC